MKPTAGQISVAARMGGSDKQICEMFALTSEQLEKFGPAIATGRAEASIALDYQKRRSIAGKFKQPAPKSA